MGVTFKIHAEGIDSLEGMLDTSCLKAEHIVALQVAKDTERYVPMRTGSLRQRTRVIGNRIIYPGPYARYLYYGKLYVDPMTGSPFAPKGATKVPATPEKNLKYWHKGTCSHWFEASKAQNKDKWVEVAKEALKHER